MYRDDSDYKYNPETAVEGKDYWYIEYQGTKVKVTKATGGGTYTHFGGPCGPLYSDRDGNS